MHFIREINPNSSQEINLVANRMRETLEEVLGSERGRNLYTLQWLQERVRWHLNPANAVAKVFLSESGDGRIIGHAIARIERGEDGLNFGYFSTIFVESQSRRKGIATELLITVQNWLAAHGVTRIVYNTSLSNEKILNLFKGHGFEVTFVGDEMLQLTKFLKAP